jgi:sugar phosphate isomerase/epimerase
MWSYYAVWAKGGFDIPKFIETAKEIGAEGVELLDFFWKDRAVDEPIVLEALKKTGIPVGVYSVSNSFISANPADRQKSLDIIEAGVDSAVKFGAKTVRVYAGNEKEGVSFEQAFEWIVQGLRASAEYAAANGVRLAIENHGKLAGKSEQVAKILDAVNHPALGANPDTGNFILVHEASEHAIKALASRAYMVHFKDFHAVPKDFDAFAYEALDGSKFAGTAVGEGDINLKACVAELKKANFDGWLNIEYEGNESALTALPRSIAATKALIDA